MRKQILLALCYIPLFGSLCAFSPAEEALPEGVTMEEFQAKVSRKAEQHALEQEAFEQALDGKGIVSPEPNSSYTKIVEKSLNQRSIFSNYTTSHKGAWHFPIGVSATGNHVILQDGSGWLTCPCDAVKTLDWGSSDTILITLAPFYSWYDYVFINCRSGARVRVTFEEKPSSHTVHTFYIKEIDLYNGRIRLSDDTLWVTAPFSHLTIRGWHVGQKVILGINDRLFSRSYANFMINQDTKEFVKAQCLY